MRILIRLTEDDYPKSEVDMFIDETESPDYKWITIADKKYSVDTKDLVLLSKLF